MDTHAENLKWALPILAEKFLSILTALTIKIKVYTDYS